MAEAEGSVMLQPGQIIRPQTTEENARELIQELYGMKVTWLKELVSYDDRNYWVKVDQQYSNPNVKAVCDDGYILKVLNSMDSVKQHVDAEHGMQKLLYSHGVLCPQPVRTLSGDEKTLKTIVYGKTSKADNNNESEGNASGRHIVRLLTFVPGTTLHQVPYKPRLLYNVGQTLGRIDKALESFSHPALMNHESVWNLKNIPKLRQFLYAVEDPDSLALVQNVIDVYSDTVLPNLSKCRMSVIHGDYNEQNMLVRPLPDQDMSQPAQDLDYENHAVLDFGDASYSYVLFDIAICCMYVMVESKIVDPLLIPGHVLAGYYKHITLNETEKDLLKLAMAGRFCQSLVMGAYSYQQDPGNEYLLVTAKNGWRLLKALWETPKEELYKNWEEIIESYKK